MILERKTLAKKEEGSFLQISVPDNLNQENSNVPHMSM